MKTSLKTAAILALAVIPVATFAQAARTTPLTGVSATLLGRTAVRRDLRLTAAQIRAISAVEATGADQDAIVQREMQILSAAQGERLLALLVGEMGSGALALTDVRARLDQSAEQEIRIGEIRGEAARARRTLRVHAMDTSNLTGAMDELERQTRIRLAAVLSPEQEAALCGLAQMPGLA